MKSRNARVAYASSARSRLLAGLGETFAKAPASIVAAAFVVACAAFVACTALAMPAIAWADTGDYAAAGDAAQTQLMEQVARMARTAESFGVAGNAKIGSRVQAVQYAGPTAQATAATEARAAFPKGSKSAILVGTGDALIDGVAAIGLTATKGPILYANEKSLGSVTKRALKSLGVRRVLIVGDKGAVGSAVVASLKRMGVKVEARLAGDTYCDTQLAVFKYGVKKGLWSKKMAFVVGGYALDALSVLPVAAAKAAPVFVAASDGSLTKAQRKAWRAWAKRGGGKQAVVVGGAWEVAKSARTFAAKAEALAGGNGKPKKFAGVDVCKTSVAVARWAVKTQGFTWDYAAFCTGWDAADALAGSVLQGQSKSVLLPVNSMQSATVKEAKKRRAAIRHVRFLGDADAIPWGVRMSIADALAFPAAAIPTFKLYLDAGHGDNNDGDGEYGSGAVANGYEEHDLNVELTRKMARILRKAYGVKVFLNDDGGPYYERHAEAVRKGCSEIVSIHFNAYGGGATTGSLTLIHSTNANAYSKRLQNKLHPHLLKAVGLANEGKRSQAVAILAGELPAVLHEICYVDNARDMKHYQKRKDYVAKTLARGIVS